MKLEHTLKNIHSEAYIFGNSKGLTNTEIGNIINKCGENLPCILKKIRLLVIFKLHAVHMQRVKKRKENNIIKTAKRKRIQITIQELADEYTKNLNKGSSLSR